MIKQETFQFLSQINLTCVCHQQFTSHSLLISDTSTRDNPVPKLFSQRQEWQPAVV